MKAIKNYKGKLLVGALLSLVLLLTLAVMPVSADDDITVTVTVTDSNSNPLQGVSVQYKKLPSTTPWPVGTTGPGGTVTKALPAGTYAFRASYAQTSSGWSPDQDISGDNNTVDFKTSSITAQVKTCAGAPISGASVWYKVLPSTTPWPLGTTGSGGTVSKELFPGTYAFRADYQHTRAADITQDVAANPLVSFTTTKVTVYYSGAVHYKELSTWWPFSKPSMELFAGTIPFRFGGPGGYEVDLVVTGCEVTAYPVLVKLLDSKGSGLAGGFAEYFRDGSWKTIGTTGSDGTVFAVLPVKPWQIRMTYEWVTNRTTQDITVDSTVVFNTIDVLVTLKTCAGVGIAGGVAEYQSGYWRPIGTTDGNGEVHKEMLPSNLLFRMTYAYGTDRFYQDTGSDPSVDFTTTKVTLAYPGTVSYQSGYWRNFTVPTMEMMPGTYLFKFEGSGPTMREWLTISGCEMGGRPVWIHFEQSNGTPIQGGKAWYSDYYLPGGLIYAGESDANGNIFVLIPYQYGTDKIDQFKGEDKTFDEFKTQVDIASNPVVTFKTVKVTVKLQDHDMDGSTNDLSGNEAYDLYVSAYGGVRQLFGSGKTTNYQETMELLPSKYLYTFEMRYGGVWEDITGVQVTPANNMVTFSTGWVRDCTVTVVKYDSYSQSPHNFPFTNNMDVLTNHYKLQFKNASNGVVYEGFVLAGQLLEIGTCP